MELLKGKLIADSVKKRIKEKIEEKVSSGLRAPHLAAILVGEDGASLTYVGNKEKACSQVGIKSTVLRFPDTITEYSLIEEIKKLNGNPEIDGFIVQMPLPPHIDEQKIIDAIDPCKDVDGFNPVNLGNMVIGRPTFLPATPFGIMTLLKEYNIETSGKNCVIIGRSNIVGKPLSIMLSAKSYPGDCTVTLCHSHTGNVSLYTKNADIVVAALGVPHFLKADMVKDGAVVIDVGITRIPGEGGSYKLAGDVDFENVAPKCSFISPVPGGVGPMTIVSLLENTYKAAYGENI